MEEAVNHGVTNGIIVTFTLSAAVIFSLLAIWQKIAGKCWSFYGVNALVAGLAWTCFAGSVVELYAVSATGVNIALGVFCILGVLVVLAHVGCDVILKTIKKHLFEGK